jgi:D-alanyl-D-alanine dipeptidase
MLQCWDDLNFGSEEKSESGDEWSEEAQLRREELEDAMDSSWIERTSKEWDDDDDD